ncbi:hypothetical protein HPB50_000047 [Hyalomma asiaticum]|uniref:Uncharacterized protein n=1 Tax=Hyalomma asiaticum TaxID=266040 RepID=A0ACB7SS01_HYAAI|nr:hypothetical protein HPB50_000047 [Hyalomma asiaticum]
MTDKFSDSQSKGSLVRESPAPPLDVESKSASGMVKPEAEKAPCETKDASEEKSTTKKIVDKQHIDDVDPSGEIVKTESRKNLCKKSTHGEEQVAKVQQPPLDEGASRGNLRQTADSSKGVTTELKASSRAQLDSTKSDHLDVDANKSASDAPLGTTVSLPSGDSDRQKGDLTTGASDTPMSRITVSKSHCDNTSGKNALSESEGGAVAERSEVPASSAKAEDLEKGAVTHDKGASEGVSKASLEDQPTVGKLRESDVQTKSMACEEVSEDNKSSKARDEGAAVQDAAKHVEEHGEDTVQAKHVASGDTATPEEKSGNVTLAKKRRGRTLSSCVADLKKGKRQKRGLQDSEDCTDSEAALKQKTDSSSSICRGSREC